MKTAATRSCGGAGIEGDDMDFLLSHWHCVVPAGIIVIVMLLLGRGRKRQDGE
jgi:hypothetical protein